MKFTVNPVDSLIWPFEGQPHFRVKDKGYTRQENVDPFPCYAHSPDLVRRTTNVLDQVMPLDGRTDVYLPAWEATGRTNGHASPMSNWDKEDTEFGAMIVLSGKRIPLHPAMTRYLVSHEYGHVVQFWVEQTHKLKNLCSAYVKDIRCYKQHPDSYGGKTWHASPGEIFANDFRIAACEIETEFWPHEGFVHPSDMPVVNQFWRLAVMDWDKALAMLSSIEKKNES